MPIRSARPCSQRGCPELVRTPGERYCEAHKKEKDAQYNAERGSAASRGYGARWRKLRLMFLRANPLCYECLNHGIIKEATDVDHIISKKSGGTDAWDNLQPLCRECHSKKTAKEDGRWGK